MFNGNVNKQIRFFGEDGDIKLNKLEVLKEEIVYDKETSEKIMKFINSFVNGAIEYSDSNNVILSANMGAVRMLENSVRFEYSLRANDLKLRDKYLENLEKIKGDIIITWEQELKGIEPDYNCSLIDRCSKIYKEIFDDEIKLKISQGVLEGGFFKEKINDLEYVCIGANTYDVHSPKERVSIKSMKETWEYIKKIISKK